MDKMNEQDIEIRQRLIDDTPGVIARKSKFYEKEMK